jgi:hypothetical protein
MELNQKNELSYLNLELIKSEIDIQIATAKNYPRNIKQALAKAMELISMNENVAASCCYALPRREKVLINGKFEFQNKAIEGPSVRLAEIICSVYGNLRSGARIISKEASSITAQGICHDLESNNCISVEVKRRIIDRAGKAFNEDLHNTCCQCRLCHSLWQCCF